MSLDIRLPMGILFSLVGSLLVVYGVLQPGSSEAANININLDWGAILILFGLSMLLLARRRALRIRRGAV